MSGRAAVQAADPKRWIRAFAGGLAECSPQASEYSKCVLSKMDHLSKGDCQVQWNEYNTCLKKKIREGFKKR